MIDCKAEDISFSICPACNDLLEPGHDCPGIASARKWVRYTWNPEHRAWGSLWIAYCLGEGPRPVDVAGTRRLELVILRLAGLADPNGQLFGADRLRGRRGPRRHTATGEEPAALRRHRLDLVNWRAGRSNG